MLTMFSQSTLSLVLLAVALALQVNESAWAKTEVVELSPPVNPNEDVKSEPIEAPKTPGKMSYESNRLIDCSTNEAYRTGVYGRYARVAGYSDCLSCHTTPPGQGVKPRPRWASFTIQNQTKSTTTYEIKTGNNGTWKPYKIKPGKLQRFSWKYRRPGDNRSPKYWIRCDNKEYRILPMATPVENLGSLYYFKEEEGTTPRFWSLRLGPYRKAD